MIFKPLTLWRFLQTPKLRFVHKYIYNMNHAYLRHLEEEEKFEITFHWTASELRVNRQFNFCRNVSESIPSFTYRVATNVEKEIRKKSKHQNQTPVHVSVILNNEEINDEAVLCRDVFIPNNNVILTVSETRYNVIVNSPWIKAAALPSSILATFMVYPTKFDAVYTNKRLSKFTWYKSKDKRQWTQVGEDFLYQPNNSDINSYLKLICVPKNEEFEGPQTEIISTVKVEASPGQCPFESRHQFTKLKCEGSTFRVVSYNILADLYCDSDYTREVLHPYCPPYALSFDYRKQLIVKELLGFNSDIICLQEVDRKFFNYELQYLLEQLNYDGDFCQKRGDVAEGLACFYDKTKFKRLEGHRFVLSDHINSNALFSEIWEKISNNVELSNRILDRSTVLQVNVLENLENDRVLVVANTHLYFHPDADHIRLLQGGMIIKHLEDYVEELRGRVDKRIGVIFCGDFNSVPECGIYQLYTTGSVEEGHIDFQSNVQQAVQGVVLQQSLPLKSACGTPPFTNFTAGFQACLDYIFYDSKNLEVFQVVPFPSQEELEQHTALPSVVFPSDHISLISDLRWTP